MSVSTAADHPDRLVALEAVHNFRDLGGYPTTDGRTTRWRTLYRADGLQRLTAADLDVLRPLGLRTVIDLRTAVEIEERGRFPHEEHPVDYHHLSVIDVLWAEIDIPSYDEDHEFLLWAYHDMLGQGRERFAQAIVRLAQPGALPAVFHCAAGKDRTGILAALILGAIGVPHEDIVADYALTAAGMERLRAWSEEQFPEAAERMNQAPSAFFAALPEAMRALLAELSAEHGSIAAYVQTIGVPAATIEELKAILLEPAGS